MTISKRRTVDFGFLYLAHVGNADLLSVITGAVGAAVFNPFGVMLVDNTSWDVTRFVDGVANVFGAEGNPILAFAGF